MLTSVRTLSVLFPLLILSAHPLMLLSLCSLELLQRDVDELVHGDNDVWRRPAVVASSGAAAAVGQRQLPVGSVAGPLRLSSPAGPAPLSKQLPGYPTCFARSSRPVAFDAAHLALTRLLAARAAVRVAACLVE